MRLYWDIETEGLPLKQIASIMPEFEAAGNIKDAEKIKASIESKKAEWLDKTALKAITGKIVAVTIALGNVEPEMVIGDENEIISRIVGELKSCIAVGGQAYAWNGSGFDLPFICQRAAIYGISAFKDLTQQRGSRFNWNECLIDPKMVWSNYSPDHSGTSLKTVASVLRVGEKSGSGKDFAALLKSNPSEAEQYAKKDVSLLRSIVQRMGI